APPGFAFLLERFQRGRNHRHQLHDDRGGDVRHDAEREDREARERPARKHVEHIEDATLLRAEQLGELVGIDPGHRYVRADAIDDERTQQEQQATFQVAHLRKSQQRFGSSQRYSALGLLSATFLSLPGRRCAFSPSGAAGGGSSMLPPAASIAVRAPLETSKPFTATLRLISPARITLALPADGGTTPAALSAARSMVSAPSLSRSDRRTSAVSFRRETNPCFGSRRCSGICPPSKPTLWYPPARDFWPLWPRPAVLPWHPNPRPTRFLLLLEPGAGLISLSLIASHQIGNPGYHAAVGRGVGHFHRLAQLPQAEAAHARAMRLLAADGAVHQGDLQPLGLFLGHCYPVISSTDLPRLAAISAGVFILVRPLIVARTTLYGLVDPRHFASTFCTPITSNTARIGPPAMIPVPSEAGCM